MWRWRGTDYFLNDMKIELTIQELLEIIDVIKYGENNEGDDFYLMQDFLDGKDDPKSKEK